MEKPRFGRLEKVNLQELWKNEGEDFLTWLAAADNLALLAETLGVDLRYETQMSSAENDCPYLVCRAGPEKRWVLVENPPGHPGTAQLGQILAHAAKYEPVTLIWMASHFSNEQKALLEWLNTITRESFEIYAVGVEFWQIDDSPYAPELRLEIAPGGFVPEAGQDTPAGTESVQVDRRSITATGMLRKVRALNPEETAPVKPATDRLPAPSAPEGDGRARDRAGSNQASPSGLLGRFKSSERQVTPSGMLRGVSIESQPDSPAEKPRRTQASAVTDTQKLYLEFWTKFWQEVIRWEDGLPPQKPMMQGWVTFPIGREDFYLIAFLSADHQLAGMGLVIDGPDSLAYYHRLLQEKDAIEREIGASLDWRELPDKEESHLYLHKRNVDPADRARWPEYQAWFAEQLETFTQVLGTRVRILETVNSRPDETAMRWS